METLAGMPSDGAKWVLQQFETRLSDGQSCGTAVALAEFIDKILEAHDVSCPLSDGETITDQDLWRVV